MTEPPQTGTLTEYVVLEYHEPKRDEETGHVQTGGTSRAYTKAGTYEARSASDAIRKHGKPGTFVAVPSRSFQPVLVKAETVTTLKLENA